ncbi:hypothetical protein ACFOLF_13515 [Paenibacillus sepulcri]|uniref:Histidine kinase n=1 Tax=Paenibacillus sepulcri TaxID=359917 RepID=A0ABS7BW86_9BACL|nr:hypothetical protein [Paenibacillus sepulcri]
MEEKRERFERLAEKRVTDVIHKLRLIGNLANKNNYDYTDEHVKQILDTLDLELRSLKGRFKEESSSEQYSFSFKKNR